MAANARRIQEPAELQERGQLCPREFQGELVNSRTMLSALLC